MKRKLKKKKKSWTLVLAALFAGFGCVLVILFVSQMPTMLPYVTLQLSDRAIAFLESVASPIRMARLSFMPPDKQIELPVYGVKLVSVSDTWQAPRGNERVHEGQDIFAPRGTPVFSGTYGFVRRISVNTLGGKHILITGAGGRRYYYAHLNEFAQGLKVGQEVGTGTVLGFVGNTGNAITTPPHLHFGMYQGRTAINPHPLLVDR